MATQVELTGPATVVPDAVSTSFILTAQDTNGNPSNVSAPTVFDLSSTSTGTATFYADAQGTTAITQITIAAGSSTATFYFKDSQTGTPTVSATRTAGDELGSDTHQFTVEAATAVATGTATAAATATGTGRRLASESSP